MNLDILIRILLTLGSQPNCDGYGVCKIEPLEQIIETKCETCVEGNIKNNYKGISITLPMRNIPDKLFIKHFTAEFFIVDADMVLPSDICKQLGLPNGYTIKSGKYPISEDKGQIVLNL